MASQRLLAHCQTLADAAASMLACAQEGRWDDLIEAEHLRASRAAALPGAPQPSELDPATQRQVQELVRLVSERDAETRRLAVTWMDQLREALSEISKAQASIGDEAATPPPP